MAIVVWTGLEVAALRAALRDTQAQFADRIGCSLEAVGKWERRGSGITLGAKYSECMDTTHRRLDDDQRERFEAALEGWRESAPATVPRLAPTMAARSMPRSRLSVAHPAGDVILGKPKHESPEGIIFQIRRMLLGCMPDSPPGDQREAAASVIRAWDLFFSARFHELERELPAALARACSTADSVVGEQRRPISIALAKLLHVSSNLLGYVAHEDLAALALLRAKALAAESGDELSLAAIEGSQAWLLAKSGMYEDAVAHADQAASRIEPRLSAASPRRIAIWGELLCYAAFAASGAGEHREARRYLRLCESAATQLDGNYLDRPEPSNVFGYTSVAGFGVVVEISAGRPTEALKLARVISDGRNGIPPTLRSRWLINVAQARISSRDDAGAVDTIRQAWSLAPEFIGHLPQAHTLTNELINSRRGHKLDGLVDLAGRLGMSAQRVGTRP
ncbi:helix-turn-helix transcriptional regulator [Nocardia cyriacigeorgica]|uniref:HTH cro/C1-type domain-containing protein n=2 Tax=Nocardia cyriacigeorgica TaxID=135487 RepID=H6R4L2_NOCCG|nr:helix-turn-helix transcriptional regulator [Nocardia cyriacigeorgica]NEW34454.1 helix-turn-helix transcriptional regulator [Nocardia cyriacigeorgica]BDT86921.1 hypothetical protein FMUAM8_26850 [Nocardia cyriacigeorgica]CCF63278.1 protein of unknown function; putative Helix-turn-helix domain [Nocardia cyriacigeorgica GUH-2]